MFITTTNRLEANAFPSPKSFFTPSSTVRKVRNLAARFFFDIWASFFARCKSLFCSSKRGDKSYAKWRFERTDLPLDQSLNEYFNKLTEKKVQFAIINHFSSIMDSSTDDFCSRIKNAKDKVFVPLIIKGRFLNHIVTLYIDKTNHSMEYFDSKGLTILDRKGSSVKNIAESSLEELVAKIATHFKIQKVSENIKKVQWDSHNCGVYVASFIQQRMDNIAPLRFSPPSIIRQKCANTLNSRF